MLTDDRSPLPFSLLYSLRSNLATNRLLSVFTIIAIATAVGLATGLEISTRSAQEELERTADALAGAAQLEITGGSLGIPDFLTDQVAAIPGVLAASPFIQKTLRIADGPQAGQPLHILGLDFLADSKVRSYRITRSDLEIRDPLMLLADPHSIIGTQRLLDRLGIEESGSFRVRTSRGPVDLVVRGLLDSEGIGDLFDGQVAAMDIFSLQLLLRREGLVDRIDIVPERGMDLSELRSSLGAAVEGFATVRRAATRNILVERMLGTVKLAVWALAIVGVLVAAFLSYGTMSMSVDRRVNEFALLQATGLEGYKVRRLIRTDALVLATIGTAIGTLLGIALSHIFIDVFSNISDHLQDVEIERVELSVATVVSAFLVGIVVSFAATFQPASRATSRAPFDVVNSVPPPVIRRGNSIAPVAILGLLLLAVVCLSVDGFPLLRIAGLYLSGTILLVLCVQAFLRPTFGLIQSAAGTFIHGVGVFVATAFRAKPTQTALTVAALCSVVAGTTAILVVLESVSVSIHQWLTPDIPGELVITGGDPFSIRATEPISSQTVGVVLRTPGVNSVLRSFNSKSIFRGEEIRLHAQDMKVYPKFLSRPALSGSWENLAAALRKGGVAISDGFSHRFGLTVGREIDLDTSMGQISFPIVGIFRDFGGPPAGTVKFDLAEFDRYWGRDGFYSLRVLTDEGSLDTANLIRDRTRDGPILFITRAEDYAQFARLMIERFIHILYLAAGSASILAALAVFNVLAGSIAARRRELGIMRAVGASGIQVFLLILLDASLLVGLSLILGTSLGLLCAVPMCDVLTATMGWTVSYSIPWSQLFNVGLVGLALVAAAAIFPSLSAAKLLATTTLVRE